MTDAYADLRSDLAGLAAADPTTLANVLVATVRRHPECEETLRGYLRGSMPSRAPADDPANALPEPAPSDLADLRKRFHVLKSRVAVRHRPVVSAGVVLDLSLGAGDEAVIIAGNVVNLRSVAALLGAAGGDVGSVLEELSHDILTQISGALSQRSMTRRVAPRMLAPAVRTSVLELDEGPLRCLQAIEASWPTAASIRRQKGEETLPYVKRVIVALRTAAAAGHGDASEALASIRDEFAELVDET